MMPMDAATRAQADQELASYQDGLDGLVATTREMLDDGADTLTAVAMVGVALAKRGDCPAEAVKNAYIAATAIVRLAQSPGGTR